MYSHWKNKLRAPSEPGSVSLRFLAWSQVWRIWVSLGTRWLSRWDRELDLLVKCCYYGLTTGRGSICWFIYISLFLPPLTTATQTLGEEYTDIWQYSSIERKLPPSRIMRTTLILSTFLPPYILGKWGQSSTLQNRHPKTAKLLTSMPLIWEVAAEVNLALFYIKGTYYDLIKRLMGIKHVRIISFGFWTVVLTSLLVIIYSERSSHETAFIFTPRNTNYNSTHISSCNVLSVK